MVGKSRSITPEKIYDDGIHTYFKFSHKIMPDIYYVNKNENNKWEQPYNMGTTINTKYNEEGVFIVPDGKTLYFSSKGHNTMGEYDVFKSVFDPETNIFSKAENLGYPINDVGLAL